MLIVGDSHIEYGLDPSLIPNNRNIATNGEPYTVTFAKLKWIFATAGRPDLVVLGGEALGEGG